MEAPQTLPVTEPQPSQVLSGFVVSHWQGPHGEHCLVVASAGVCRACRVDLLVSCLEGLEPPVCLLCAERRVAECHRLVIAEFLAARGAEVEHLE